MKRIKSTAIILAALMAVQTLVSAVSATSVADAGDDTFTPADGTVLLTPSVADASSDEGNLLASGDFDSSDCMTYLKKSGTLDITHVTDDNGGHIRLSSIAQSHHGVIYTPENTVSAGKYLFTGCFRTLRVGELTELRLIFEQTDKQTKVAYVYPENDWRKVEFYVELTADLKNIRVCGGAAAVMRQDYCIDQFSLVAVNDIPADSPTSFGTKVTRADVESVMGPATWTWDAETESQYTVEGLIINQDFSDFLSESSKYEITKEDISQFAYQFDGTHITDYFISVNDVCSMFPNNVVTSYLDKYYWTEENGVEVDYTEDTFAKGSVYLYETLGVDPIGILHEAFREIGINPWISVRINDQHEMHSETESIIFSEFYHKYPEIRRVQHHRFPGTSDKVMNYTYELVREYMLSFINEALNRYDTYGIEIDFLREMWLWHIGGEYAGLDIFNEFMRQVDDLVAIYEEKYGHKIKIATRVGYDIETNYNFGLDVITWMAEGIVDMIIPASRWATNDMDIPTRMWDSITEPYGVELAVSMEQTRLRTLPEADSTVHTKMDIETMSAFAANAFSQGADKVYIFNYYKTANDFFTSSDKINSSDPGYATMWSALSTLGSHEKLMLMNRRNLITYRDMKPVWSDVISQLPKTVNSEKFTTLRIPIGDIANGSNVRLKFSASEASAFSTLPTVYVNSTLVDYSGLDFCYYSSFTDDMLLCYDIPEALWNNDYLIVEIKSNNTNGFTIDYAEVFVKAPISVLN